MTSDGRLAALLLPLVREDSSGERLRTCALFAALGGWMILAGRHRVRARRTEASREHGLFSLRVCDLGGFRGPQAVRMGWTTIGVGVFAIVLGVAHALFGAVLER